MEGNLGQQGFPTSWRSSQQHTRWSTEAQRLELLWGTHWSLAEDQVLAQVRRLRMTKTVVLQCSEDADNGGARLFTSMAMVSSSLMSCRAPTSSQVTSGTVAKPSLLAEGWTLDREARKSDMRMDRPASSSSDRLVVFFNNCRRCHRSPCWTRHHALAPKWMYTAPSPTANASTKDCTGHACQSQGGTRTFKGLKLMFPLKMVT